MNTVLYCTQYSNMRGCQCGLWCAGQEKIRETSTNKVVQRAHRNRNKAKAAKKETDTVPFPTLTEFPLCCLPSIYFNKDEAHLYTNISKVYLASLRPYYCYCSPELPDR